jgi:hypothetical protein
VTNYFNEFSSVTHSNGKSSQFYDSGMIHASRFFDLGTLNTMHHLISLPSLGAVYAAHTDYLLI